VFPFFETFDVGVDTRKPVNDKDYQVTFHFNGKLNQLTFRLGHEAGMVEYWDCWVSLSLPA
jgi:hypothetical protein